MLVVFAVHSLPRATGRYGTEDKAGGWRAAGLWDAFLA